MYTNNDEQILRKSLIYMICLNMISRAVSGLGSVNSLKDSGRLSNTIFDELVLAAKTKANV